MLQKLGEAPVVRSQPSMLKRAKSAAGVVRSAPLALFVFNGNTGALCKEAACSAATACRKWHFGVGRIISNNPSISESVVTARC